MTSLSQRDPRWAGIALGNGSTTIGGYGCLITCLAMVAETTPDIVNNKLKSVGGYSNDLVIWAKVKEAIGWDFVYPLPYDNEKVKEQITTNGFCLIKVDWDGKISTPSDMHFVLYIGNQQMIDPWTGVTKSTSYYPLVTGYCPATKITTSSPYAVDEKNALAVLSDYQKLSNSGNLEGAARSLVGKAGELETAIKSMQSLKQEIADRDKHIIEQDTIIKSMKDQMDQMFDRLGVAEIEDALGKIERSMAYKADLDNARKIIESKDREIAELQKTPKEYIRLFGNIYLRR